MRKGKFPAPIKRWVQIHIQPNVTENSCLVRIAHHSLTSTELSDWRKILSDLQSLLFQKKHPVTTHLVNNLMFLDFKKTPMFVQLKMLNKDTNADICHKSASQKNC